MKKATIIIAVIILCATQGYSQSILERNKVVDVNIGYNNSGSFQSSKHPYVTGVSGVGVSINVYGVHIGFSSNIEGNESSNMGVDYYDGYKTRAVHIGYSIPLCDWFKVTPVIGYSKWAEGYYDGSDYTIGDNGVTNHFHMREGYQAFDYGVLLNFTVVKYLNLYANITAHNYGLGIGVKLPFDLFIRH